MRLPTFNPDADEWCVGRGCDFDWNRHVAAQMSAGPVPYFGLSADSSTPPHLVTRWFHVPRATWAGMDPGQQQGLIAQAQQQEAGYQKALGNAVAHVQSKADEHGQVVSGIPGLIDQGLASLDVWVGTVQECADDVTTEMLRTEAAIGDVFEEIERRVRRANDLVGEALALIADWQHQDPFDFDLEAHITWAAQEYLEAPIERLRATYASTEKSARAAYTACARRLARPCTPTVPCGAGYSCVSGRCSALFVAEAALPPLPKLELARVGAEPTPWLLYGAMALGLAAGAVVLWQGVHG